MIEYNTPTTSKRQPIDKELSLTNLVSHMATEAQCHSDAFYYWCQETRLHQPLASHNQSHKRSATLLSTIYSSVVNM
jgi:hypothetical protein